MAEKKKVILTVARFSEQKDYDTNLSSCKELLNLREDFVFWWVGTGKLFSKFQELIYDCPTYLLGQRDDVPKLLEDADIAFLPSLYEGCSNFLIEALSSGVPIVCSDIPENREFFEGCALFVKPGDSQGFAEAIDLLLNDSNLRESFVKCSLEKRKTFKLQNMVKAYEEVYIQLV